MTKKVMADGSAIPSIDSLVDSGTGLKATLTKGGVVLSETSIDESGVLEEAPSVGEPVISEKEKTSLDDLNLEEKSLRDKIFTQDVFVTINDNYKIHQGIYELLKRSIYNRTNILLLGSTGSGKTELVMNLAKEMDLPLHIFDMGTMVDPIMSLVGTHIITTEDGKSVSKFCTSRFSEVIQKPGIVLLDELSRANVMANNLLFPCLDSRRELSMEYSFHNHEPIKIHPECIFIATANLGGQYTGTHRLDHALLSRFMVVHIAEPPIGEIQDIIEKEFELSKKESKTIVDIYKSINDKHERFEIQINLTIRNLKTICNLVKSGFTIYDAFYIVTDGLSFSTNDKEQQKLIEAILNEK